MESNSDLWNNGGEEGQNIARARKRQTTYIANILVVKDPANPENNGQVKLFRFGQKIFDKINNKLNPTFEGEDKINVFDLWDGANFKLKVKKVKGYQNYDDSEFDAVSAVSKKDEELKTLWESEHGLKALIAPDQFKPYAELESLFKAWNEGPPRVAKPATDSHDSGDNDGENTDDIPFNTGDDEDDPRSFFNRIRDSED